jgi:hypothetical protein
MTEALEVVAVAFALVFTGMGILTALVYALNAVKNAASRRAARASAPAPQGGIDPRTVAVLAAAVHAALGRPARIHRIHVHRERGDEAWLKVGRMDLLLTHRVQPRQPS